MYKYSISVYGPTLGYTEGGRKIRRLLESSIIPPTHIGGTGWSDCSGTDTYSYKGMPISTSYSRGSGWVDFTIECEGEEVTEALSVAKELRKWAGIKGRPKVFRYEVTPQRGASNIRRAFEVKGKLEVPPMEIERLIVGTKLSDKSAEKLVEEFKEGG